MKRMKHWMAALACIFLATNAFAVASSVTTNTISYELTDLRPDDGIAPGLVFGTPVFNYYSASQALNVTASLNDAFIDLRCGECPVTVGQAEIHQRTDTVLAGHTLGPSSLYVDAAFHLNPTNNGNFIGVTAWTKVKVSVDATFNDGLAAPVGSASLAMRLVGASFFPDESFTFGGGADSSSTVNDPRHGRVEASFSNVGERLAPFTFMQVSEVSGRSGPMAPIPEPETYVLMTAGLCAVVWWTRRRRR
jgi:hypothetical protein